MCTGRVETLAVVEALQGGADGVLVVGCRFGECHYEGGNYQFDSRIEVVARLLASLGIDRGRIAFRQCSSAEGAKFAATVNEFQAAIQALGPLGAAECLDPREVRQRLALGQDVLRSPKIRWVLGKAVEFQREGNKYHERFTRHELGRCLEGIIVDELATQGILRALRESVRGAPELAVALQLPCARVVRYLEALRRRQLISVTGVRGRTPLYALKAGDESCVTKPS